MIFSKRGNKGRGVPDKGLFSAQVLPGFFLRSLNDRALIIGGFYARFPADVVQGYDGERGKMRFEIGVFAGCGKSAQEDDFAPCAVKKLLILPDVLAGKIGIFCDVCFEGIGRSIRAGFHKGRAGKLDVFDALVAVRVYKPAMPFEKAVSIIKESSGEQDFGIITYTFLANASGFFSVSL